MNDLQLPALSSAINRYLDIGRRTLRLQDLQSAIGKDVTLAHLVLKQWELSGWIKLLGNPVTDKPEDPLMEVFSYIDNQKPFSDPMSGKM